MKALVYHRPGRLDWQDWPQPTLGPGQAMVSVAAVGICGSDLHGFQGHSNRRRAPMVMGHEFTGVVAAVADDADRPWVGQRVVVRPFLHCAACDMCRAGRENLCRNRQYIGTTIDGAMAESVAVPVSNLLALPAQLSDDQGALTEPLAVALHAATRCGAIAGRRALVVGGGTIGLLTLHALKQGGIGSVTLIEPIPYRQGVAAAIGARALGQAPPDEEFDIAIDALGSETTFATCMQHVRPGGVLVALGGWKSVALDLSRLVAREIDLRGSFNFGSDTFALALRWLAEGRIDTAPLLTRRMPLHDGAGAFSALAERRIDDIKVILHGEPAR